MGKDTGKNEGRERGVERVGGDRRRERGRRSGQGIDRGKRDGTTG